MSLITTLCKPDSTLHAVYAKVISQREYHLVTAKNSSIDIYSITKGGLVLFESLPVYGQIESLTNFQPAKKGGTTDWILFSLTDGSCYVVCYWNGRFISFKSAEVETKDAFTPVNSSLVHKAVVDPSGSFIAIYMTVGYISLFKMSKKTTEIISKPGLVRDGVTYSLDNIFEKSNIIAPIDFINIENMIFIPGMKSPTIAIIHNQHQIRGNSLYNINILTIDSAGSKLTSRNNWKNVDLMKYHLIIPVFEPLGGFILVGLNSLIYCNGSEKLRTGQGTDKLDTETIVFKEGGETDENELFTTFTKITFNKYLIGSKSGKLYLLFIEVVDDDKKKKIASCSLTFVGRTSPGTQLIYLSSNYFFISSHSSLSVMFQLLDNPLSITIVQELENLAPIVDFIIEDDFNNNSSIIACSGGYYGSSIKRIEYSYQIESLIEVQLDDDDDKVRSVWQIDDVTVLGYRFKTRVLKSDKNGDFSELSQWKGIKLDIGSILVGKLNNAIVQVTENEVILPELSKTWQAPETVISFASLSLDSLIICTNRKSIIIFDSSLVMRHSQTFDDFISSLTINPQGTFAISFWNTSNILVIDHSKSSFTLHTNSSLVRSLLLTDEVIVIGMADGTLLIYDFDNVLVDKFVIGNQPISLYPFDDSIIVVSNEMVMLEWQQPEIYGNKKYFPVKMNFEIPSNLAKYQYGAIGCILFITDDALKVSKINRPSSYICTQEKRLKGQFIRRISQNIPLGFTIIGAMSLSGRGDSTIYLLESASFEAIDSFGLNPGETCENVLSVSSDLIEFDGFIIGTSIDDGSPTDQSLSTGRGRILLFTSSKDSCKLKLEHELELPGSVFKIELIDERLTAPTVRFLITVQSRIKELLLNRISDGSFKLELIHETSLQSSTIPLFISSLGDQVVIGELLRKVTLGNYTPSSELSNAITSVGGYWQSNVILTDKNEILVADNEFNLLILKPTPTLEVASSYHLGELVNQVRRLQGTNRWSKLLNNGVIKPKAILGTASGGVYLYSEIKDAQLVDDLTKVRDEIISNSKTINAPLGGDEGINLYHKYRSPLSPASDLFIDGDIIKEYTSLPSSKQTNDSIIKISNILKTV